MLRALVIYVNEKVKDVGSLLAIARAEAQKREHTHRNLVVRAIKFIPELGVYVAFYEPLGCSRRLDARRGKEGER
ncbi:MAG: hypothetical protein ACE5OW_06375 [Candidatus Bathyarchaeia archaeon]